jgi:hypothetical protein
VIFAHVIGKLASTVSICIDTVGGFATGPIAGQSTPTQKAAAPLWDELDDDELDELLLNASLLLELDEDMPPELESDDCIASQLPSNILMKVCVPPASGSKVQPLSGGQESSGISAM